MRVVVTGIGVVSPIGIGKEAFWSSLKLGQSGIGPITLFDASSFPVRIGGQVKSFDRNGLVREFQSAENVRDRKVLLALVAAKEAIDDADLPDSALSEALLHVGVGLEAIWLGDLTPYVHSSNLSLAMVSSLIS